MRAHLASLLLVLLVPFVMDAHSAPVPALNVEDLLTEADLVATVIINSVEQRGGSSVSSLEPRLSEPSITAVAIVGQVLKGTISSPTLEIHLVPADGSMSYGRIHTGDQIVFLKKSADGYYPVSPYYPSLATVSGARANGREPSERLSNVLREGLGQNVDTQIRLATIRALSTIAHPAAIEALNFVLSDSDEEVRLAAAAALLSMGQITALTVAEAVLLGQGSTSASPAAVHNLRVAIAEGVRDEAAVPALQRLMVSRDASTRLAATKSMARMKQHAAIGPLLNALDDSDFNVRLYAIHGLASISGKTDLLPSADAFRSDEVRFITPLRAWAASAPN